MRPHSVPITLPLLFGGAARTLLAMSAAAAAAHDAPNAPAPPPTPGGHRDVPRWSWDTIQTYMHCANLTGEWNDAALDAMAKMSYVTFESSHKMSVSLPRSPPPRYVTHRPTTTNPRAAINQLVNQ